MILGAGIPVTRFAKHTPPRIGYQSLFDDATLTGDGTDIDNAFDWLTWDVWESDVRGGTITATLDEGQTANYFGVAGQDAYLVAGVITLQYYDYTTGSWTEAASIAPGDTHVYMATFDTVGSDRWRIVTTSATAFNVGVFAAGMYLELDRGCYGGFAPPRMAQTPDLLTNGSQSGALLGRSVVRSGFKGTFTLSHLRHQWVHNNMRTWLDVAQTRGWFLQWDPDGYPNEAAYAWTLSEPVVSNQSARYMQTTVQIEGIE